MAVTPDRLAQMISGHLANDGVTRSSNELDHAQLMEACQAANTAMTRSPKGRGR